MGDHDFGVTKNYLPAENSVDEGFWDEVYREKEYYEDQDVPHVEGDGRVKGEFDVLAVNKEYQVFLYVEVKTNFGDLGHARDQLSRAENHFSGWDMIRQTWLEQ